MEDQDKAVPGETVVDTRQLRVDGTEADLLEELAF
jgi:hypothetical protein